MEKNNKKLNVNTTATNRTSILKKYRKFKNSGSYSRKLKATRKLIDQYSTVTTSNSVLPACSISQKLPRVSSESCCFKPKLDVVIETQLSSKISSTSVREVEIDDVNETTEDELETADSTLNSYEVQEKVRKWANMHNITQIALKDLLKIINNSFNCNLPQDPRTVMHTPSAPVEVSSCGEGQYWHNSLEVCLRHYFVDLRESIEISININIDGLPVYKSSKYEFWPILFNIFNMPDFKPMVIGIYCGQGKPKSATEFLSPFVTEMNNILRCGVNVNEHNIKVEIRCFICDSPARAFIKGVVNFNGQHGCLKCTTVGEYSYLTHCNVFPRINMPKTTDETFRKRADEDHHKSKSPLESLTIDMVNHFPVGDALHLLHIGHMKRLLLGWRDGSFKKFSTKWSAVNIQNISNIIVKLKMPEEIHRCIRSLDNLAYWKASELRTFLHYISIIILEDYLPNDAFLIFKKLYCAVTICSSSVYCELIHVAEIMLKDYVQQFMDIYGTDYATSNVHNLTHLVDEVKQFGILTSFDAYPFENMLGQIKRLLRTGNKPLQQTAKRLYELGNISQLKEKTLYPSLHAELTNFDCKDLPPCNSFFQKIKIKDGLTISTSESNKWFLTKCDEIVAMKGAGLNNEIFFIYGSSLTKIDDLFKKPIKSSTLNIYTSESSERNLNVYPISDIKCKLVAVEYKNKRHFIPLLHTLDMCI